MLRAKYIYQKWLMLLVYGVLFSVVVEANNTEPMGITVTLIPLKSMVETIGGEHVSVTVMVPPGTHPRSFEPSPKQMVALESSSVYISMGIPHESNWLPQIKAARPDMPILNMIDQVATRSKDSDGEIADPHIWLGPSQLRVMATSLRDTLIMLAPNHEAEFIENTSQWLAALNAADDGARARLAPYKGKSILVFHPAYGYFTDEYGIKQIAIEEKGMEPGPKMIAASIRAARKQNIKTIFVQAQFSDEEARIIASEIGGEVVKLNPLSDNLVGNITTMATSFEASFQQ